MTHGMRKEARRDAAALLSTTGAAVAGAGVGALLSSALERIATPLLIVGIAAHLGGMVGSRRLQAGGGSKPPRWATAAYWLCWALIAALVLYAAASALQVW